MNPRERMLALILGTLVGVGGGGFLFYTFFYQPYKQRTDRIKTLQADIEQKQARKQQIEEDAPKLRAWQQLSLPGSPSVDPARTKREYEVYLSDVIARSNIPARAVKVEQRQVDAKTNPVLAGKGPIYTKLAYTITFKTDSTGRERFEYAGLVNFLRNFYQGGLLQEVRSITIKRGPTTAQRPVPDLEATLIIEALILPGASERPFVMPNLDRRTLMAEVLTGLRGRQAGLFLAAWSATPAGPLGPAVLAQPPRDYTVMASKNIFLGVPAAVAGKPTILCPRSTWLSQISSDDNHTEAFFWDVVLPSYFASIPRP